MLLSSFFKISLKFFRGSSVASLASFFAMIILVKNLELTEYGLLILVQAIVMFIEGVSTSQSWQTVVRYYKIDSRIASQTLYVDGVNVVFSLLLLLVACYISEWLGAPAELLVLYGLILPFKFLGTWSGIARELDEVGCISRQMQIVGFGKFFTAILTYIYALGINEIIMLFVFFEIMGALYFVRSVLTKVKLENLIQPFNFDRGLVRFTVITHLNATTVLSVRYFDELLVAKTLGVETLAVYKVIKTIVAIISKLVEPMYLVIYPMINRMIIKVQKHELKILLAQISIIFSLVGVFFILGVVLLGDVGLLYLTGKEVGYNALIVHTVGVTLNLIFFYAHPLAIATGNEGRVFILNIILGGFYLLSLMFIGGTFGLLGVSILALTYTVLSALFRLFFSISFFRSGF